MCSLLTAFCVWGAWGIHKLCFPCSAVTYFWDAMFDRFLLPTCWWMMGLWATENASIFGASKLTDSLFERWHEDKVHRQAVVNGASWTSFCPRWSAIMSVTIRQFIWAAPLQMMSVLGRHIVCIWLPFVGGELRLCSLRRLSSSASAVSKSCSWSQLTSERPRCSVIITVLLWNVEHRGGHLQRCTDRYTDMSPQWEDSVMGMFVWVCVCTSEDYMNVRLF